MSEADPPELDPEVEAALEVKIERVARGFVELDLGIKRQIDRNKPVHGVQPDAGTHADNLQRAKEILYLNVDKIIQHEMSTAYMKSLLQPIVRDYSTRSSGWILSEWDSRKIWEAREKALAMARDSGEIDRLTREIYIENGGSAKVYDRVYGEPLRLDLPMEDGEEDGATLLDLIPDSSPGPEEQVVNPRAVDQAQIDIETYIAEQCSEAEAEWLYLVAQQGTQAKAANVLHISEGYLSKRLTAIREDYESWKATRPVEGDESADEKSA